MPTPEVQIEGMPIEAYIEEEAEEDEMEKRAESIEYAPGLEPKLFTHRRLQPAVISQPSPTPLPIQAPVLTPSPTTPPSSQVQAVPAEAVQAQAKPKHRGRQSKADISERPVHKKHKPKEAEIGEKVGDVEPRGSFGRPATIQAQARG